MQTLNWCDRSSRLIKSPSTSMAASKLQQHHSQTFSSATIRQGIGTSSTGAAAAVGGIATESNATSSPPTMSGQHSDGNYDKKSAYFSSGATGEPNDATDNSCLTSPNKLIMPAVQKSPSESLSSKTDTDGKKCSGKARNKEGTTFSFIHYSSCTNLFVYIYRSYKYIYIYYILYIHKYIHIHNWTFAFYANTKSTWNAHFDPLDFVSA